MNYTEAVRIARAGDEKGFSFLYEQTYQSKYYLALQYMKNEEVAKDVLQEAYIKAFAKLDTLKQPEAFSGWLGIIVANTAKNMLKRNNPLLFSDITVDDESKTFEYQIEDDNLENQPEIAYTRQETQKLVHELIDALSEEQRICILMYHIEGISISEIASTMECSENTVKSRLTYGRNNLKTRAEELQKKGYKLYSIAPLPLLLYLLRSESAYLSADGALTMVGKEIAEHIAHSSTRTQGADIPNVMQKASVNGAKSAVKSGVLHTTAGKVTAIIAGLCIVGGTVFYGVTQTNTKDPKPEVEATQEQIESESETMSETEEPIEQVKTETAEAPKETEPKPEEETTQESSEFPVGNYSYVAQAGGTRASLTIDASGLVTITTISSRNGQSEESVYQMSVDNTVTVPNGVTAYLLQSIDGGDNRALAYDANQGILSDVSGHFDWERY